MRIAVSGASGLIGGALCRALAARGDRVLRLVRRTARGDDEISWDWPLGRLEVAKLEDLDGFVHLAGKSIAVRWNAQTLKQVRESRVHGTAHIAESLAGLERPPGVLVSASAIGFYGDGRGRNLDDLMPRGEGWMAGLCEAWEAATLPAAKAGIRVALPRIGVVLSAEGGALRKMLPAFRLGLGGRLGDGKQGMSWIGLHDLVRILIFAIDNAEVSGAIVATAPHPVSNDEFTRTLARVLRRPAILPVPAFVISMMFGEMGRRLLLDGDFIRPTRLQQTGFRFDDPTLEPALRRELDRI
ncbi:MAG: TIGR01777 family protein [Acidobacteria bacterium]|nr:TIGR01777 family protein [Acidobacteriota bacterium]NIM63828.1 TIGR01777 family protein [Acidobacteriota bacterium]NIO59762.1 TIGR01777 family protein [Acidobacteriota bacterium]NIQ30845.1 TIGR01777 family protein [Acidobacteriota bacterium]NIQ85918.1 TIGR01777 family protein [Acidobacteriota bacterium]